MYQKINHYIETLKEKYVQIWIDVCNLESPTRDKAGVDRVGQYFAQRGKELGFLVEVYPQAVAGDVITLTMNPEAKGGVAMSGHIDTVHPVGLFGSPAVRVEGDRIYGPGTLDCKGGVVGALMAMEALSLAGCKDRVMLLLQTDEEVGSSISGRATIHYICEKAKDCKAFFNCEGHRDGNGVTLYRKGILRYHFEVIGQAFHASRCFAGGKSAI
ncbi:MAG: M20/M25/M40 family metallo-hydrolase, partial [Clostridia bacterium]|nr:M20/M25/M40 family metallo-hydrolase [Clostridia bacterium]